MSIVRSQSAYPKDERIFKKLYDLCKAYEARLGKELASIDHYDSELIKKNDAITNLLAELANNKNNNDQKIKAIAEKLAQVKTGLSEKRGLGKAAPFIDSNGKRLVANLEALLTPRLKIVNFFTKKNDLYFVEIDRTLVKFDEKSQPQFNIALMKFLKGKKIFLVRSFDLNRLDYVEPLCSKIQEKLAEQGVTVQAICMPKDVYGVSRAYNPNNNEAKAVEYKYELGDTYRQEVKPLEDAIIQANKTARALLTEQEFQLCKENMEFQEIFNYLKNSAPPETKQMPLAAFLSLVGSVEKSGERLAFLKINVAAIELKFKNYLQIAQEQKLQTTGDLLDYLEKNSPKLKLSPHKVKDFHPVEVSLSKLARLRGTRFFEQTQLKNFNESNLHRKAMDNLHLSRNDRVIVINSDKETHSLIKSMHWQEKYSHDLCITQPFASKKEGETFGCNDPSHYVSQGEFSAAIYSPPTLLIQLELQNVLCDPYNLNLLKVEAKKAHLKVKLHNQTYLLPPAIGEMVRLFQALPQEATAFEIYQLLLVLKDTVNAHKKDFSHGIAHAFYQVIAEGLEGLTVDPEAAQRTLSAGLLTLEKGLRGNPVTVSQGDSFSEAATSQTRMSFEQIQRELLNPENLREWSTHLSPQPQKRFGRLFSASIKKENVLVHQPSGQWNLYTLPEPIAKMVLLALNNNPEDLLQFVIDVIKSPAKLGEKPSHHTLKKSLKNLINPDHVLHLHRTLV